MSVASPAHARRLASIRPTTDQHSLWHLVRPRAATIAAGPAASHAIRCWQPPAAVNLVALFPPPLRHPSRQHVLHLPYVSPLINRSPDLFPPSVPSPPAPMAEHHHPNSLSLTRKISVQPNAATVRGPGPVTIIGAPPPDPNPNPNPSTAQRRNARAHRLSRSPRTPPAPSFQQLPLWLAHRPDRLRILYCARRRRGTGLHIGFSFGAWARPAPGALPARPSIPRAHPPDPSPAPSRRGFAPAARCGGLASHAARRPPLSGPRSQRAPFAVAAGAAPLGPWPEPLPSKSPLPRRATVAPAHTEPCEPGPATRATTAFSTSGGSPRRLERARGAVRWGGGGCLLLLLIARAHAHAAEGVGKGGGGLSGNRVSRAHVRAPPSAAYTCRCNITFTYGRRRCRRAAANADVAQICPKRAPYL